MMKRFFAALVILAAIAGLAHGQIATVTGPEIKVTLGHYFSAASTNATSVSASFTRLNNLTVINTTATLYYVKLYDKASAPNCGTDVPVATYPVPFGASSAGGGVVIDFSQPAVFVNGLAFCITGALADNDSTNAATGVVVNLLYR